MDERPSTSLESCSSCGAQVVAGAKFCGNCGSSVNFADSESGQIAYSSPVAIPGSAVPMPGAPMPAPGTHDVSVYATWGSRLVALVVNGLLNLLVGAVGLGVAMAIGTSAHAKDGPSVAALVYLIAWSLVPWLYSIAADGSASGQTIGRKMLGIRLVRADDGGRVGYLRAIGRDFSRIVSSVFLIGYLAPLWTPRRQTFHDSIAGTVVIVDRSKYSVRGPVLFVVFLAVLMGVGTGAAGVSLANSYARTLYEYDDSSDGAYDDFSSDSSGDESSSEALCYAVPSYEVVDVATDGDFVAVTLVWKVDPCKLGESIGSSYETMDLYWADSNENDQACHASYNLSDSYFSRTSVRTTYTMNCAMQAGSQISVEFGPGVLHEGADTNSVSRYSTVSLDSSPSSVRSTTTTSSSAVDGGADRPNVNAPSEIANAGPLATPVTFDNPDQTTSAGAVERLVKAYSDGDVAEIRSIDPSKVDETVEELELPDSAWISVIGASDQPVTSPATSQRGYLVHSRYYVMKGNCREEYDVWWLVDESSGTVVQEHGIDDRKTTVIAECP